ncbi:MAG: DUF2203 domain-containing protein [Ktedonobacterales bacterium]|nr:DUF2203 domain-containing protein [Ktedonobacterales bacterium]
MPTYFTRAEAEALLPQLEPLLRDLQSLHTRHGVLEERLLASQKKILGNGHGQHENTSALRKDLSGVETQAAERLHQVAELGALVKDIETGLVDFLARRQGREIYLCWRLGEPRIAWWHDIEAGVAGRQPLDEREH